MPKTSSRLPFFVSGTGMSWFAVDSSPARSTSTGFSPRSICPRTSVPSALFPVFFWDMAKISATSIATRHSRIPTAQSRLRVLDARFFMTKPPFANMGGRRAAHTAFLYGE